jgi:uncharacterized membrane protein YdfJ with MMPL/SSD domain
MTNQPQSKAMAIVALICAVIAIVSPLIMIILVFVSVMAAFVSLILGFISISQKQPGKGMAVTAIVLAFGSMIPLPFYVIEGLFFTGFLHSPLGLF